MACGCNRRRETGQQNQSTLDPPHSVAQKANQLDYHRSINDWFDHYLKGNDPQNWITKGVTVLDRERELKGSGRGSGIGASTSGTGNGGGQF